jgi:putative toxin-antitoxin system antitoxin component (TIGR02293 family)
MIGVALMMQFKPCLESSTESVWEIVGIPSRGVALYTALNNGLSFSVYQKIANLVQLDKKEIATFLHLAPATIARRAKTGKFNREESDKFYRLTEVVDAAIALFEGDINATNQWLKNPVRGLGFKKPIEMLATTAETEAVLDLIGRLEHGVFA